MSSFEAGSRHGRTGSQLGIGSSNFNSDGSQMDPPADFDQLHVIVPLILALLLVLVAIAGFAVCIKRSKNLSKYSRLIRGNVSIGLMGFMRRLFF